MAYKMYIEQLLLHTKMKMIDADDWKNINILVRQIAANIPLSKSTIRICSSLSDAISAYFTDTEDLLKYQYSKIISDPDSDIINQLYMSVVSSQCILYIDKNEINKIHQLWHQLPYGNEKSIISLLIHSLLTTINVNNIHSNHSNDAKSITNTLFTSSSTQTIEKIGAIGLNDHVNHDASPETNIRESLMELTDHLNSSLIVPSSASNESVARILEIAIEHQKVSCENLMCLFRESQSQASAFMMNQLRQYELILNEQYNQLFNISSSRRDDYEQTQALLRELSSMLNSSMTTYHNQMLHLLHSTVPSIDSQSHQYESLVTPFPINAIEEAPNNVSTALVETETDVRKRILKLLISDVENEIDSRKKQYHYSLVNDIINRCTETTSRPYEVLFTAFGLLIGNNIDINITIEEIVSIIITLRNVFRDNQWDTENILDLDNIIKTMKGQILSSKTKINSLNQTNKLYIEKYDECRAINENLSKQYEACKDENTNHASLCKQLKTENRVINNKLTQLQNDLKVTKGEGDDNCSKEQFKQYDYEMKVLKAENEALLLQIDKNHESFQDRLQRIQEKYNEKEAEKDKELSQKEQYITEIINHLEEVDADSEELRKKLTKAETLLVRVNIENENLRESMSHLSSQVSYLNKMESPSSFSKKRIRTSSNNSEVIDNEIKSFDVFKDYLIIAENEWTSYNMYMAKRQIDKTNYEELKQLMTNIYNHVKQKIEYLNNNPVINFNSFSKEFVANHLKDMLQMNTSDDLTDEEKFWIKTFRFISGEDTEFDDDFFLHYHALILRHVDSKIDSL